MSRWASAVEAVEKSVKPEEQLTKKAKGGGKSGGTQDTKLLLQLEARMREREASDDHFKGPTGHPVFLAIKEATTKYEKL
eukprot:108440-Pyramimonas_sp.AAC.1